MITLGLTGSIGMGKTTTAQMFRERGIPVWDADETVHRLYTRGGSGTSAISGLYSDAVSSTGVDRNALKKIIANDPTALGKIEALIHPLVSKDRDDFKETHREEPLVVFDIPLLFETGADKWLDRVAVVSTTEAIQRARVLDRPGMTEAHLGVILSKQLPDTEKRARADFVIDTTDMDTATRGVDHVLKQVRGIHDA